MKKLLTVAIIIPTLNRKKVLKEALLSLNGLDYPRDRFEVVVVSDGSTDGTDEMIEKLREKLNYKLVFLKEKHAGISYAKNVAIKNSKGEIIVSTDDDCLFESDWLKKLIEPLGDPKIGSVGGPDRTIKSERTLAKAIDFTFSSFIGSGGIHGRFIKVKLGKFHPHGCNMAFRRKTFEKAGPFDEHLAPGEDTDFNHRVEKLGLKLVYLPEAFVWHRPRSSFKSFVRYIVRRGEARIEVLQRHREFAEVIYFFPAIMILGFFSLVLFSLFSKLGVYLLTISVLIYFFALMVASISAYLLFRKVVFFFLIPPLIFIQHLLYGLGFLKSGVRYLWNRLKK